MEHWNELIKLFLCLSFAGFVVYQLRKLCVLIFSNKHETVMFKKRQAHELAIVEKQMEKQKAEYDFNKEALFPHKEKMKEIEQKYNRNECIDLVKKVKDTCKEQ